MLSKLSPPYWERVREDRRITALTESLLS